MSIDLMSFFNFVFGVVAFLGGFIMKSQSDRIKDLESSNVRLSDRLQDYVLKDEFREFRAEQRDSFNRLFAKVDAVAEQISNKADRHEVAR